MTTPEQIHQLLQQAATQRCKEEHTGQHNMADGRADGRGGKNKQEERDESSDFFGHVMEHYIFSERVAVSVSLFLSPLC